MNVIEAQPSIIVKGNVYINDIIKKPDKVSINFTSKTINATIYNDGRYIIVFTDEKAGSIGTFNISYQNNYYIPSENLTIIEGKYLYDLDLHIEVSNGVIPQKQESFNQFDIIKPVLPFIVIFLTIILLIIIGLIIIQNIKTEPKRQRIFYIKKINKITEKEAIPKIDVTTYTDEEIKSIEEQVDELLSKKNLI